MIFTLPKRHLIIAWKNKNNAVTFSVAAFVLYRIKDGEDFCSYAV